MDSARAKEKNMNNLSSIISRLLKFGDAALFSDTEISSAANELAELEFELQVYRKENNMANKSVVEELTFEEYWERYSCASDTPKMAARAAWILAIKQERRLQEARPTKRAADALRCEEEGCKEPAVMFYCEGHAP